MAVCRLWSSFRLTPTWTPCVNTLLPSIVPYAPSGANVTLLLLASSRQLDGTFTRNTFPSEYVVMRESGRGMFPALGRESGTRPDVPVG